ncbi:fibronectin type III domain-containing protein [Streptomyces sp. NPDC058401]|uniref:fibronectin type III domain-containing protein n=1 Tax=Streptomyces sp. NPDC058401 TaxID=3346480 RepID=UPI00365682B1
MPIKDKKTSLNMGLDLTSEPYDMAGRTEPEPATVAERLADRASWSPPYGSGQVPPAPLWNLSADGTPVSGGWQTSREIQLCWRSGVGEAAGSGSYSGTVGLDLAGISGHNLYMAEGEDPMPTTPTKVLGPRVNALVDGLKADAEYRIQIAAFSPSGVGPKSEILTMKTQAAAA